jgi:hypothetical protein
MFLSMDSQAGAAPRKNLVSVHLFLEVTLCRSMSGCRRFGRRYRIYIPDLLNKEQKDALFFSNLFEQSILYMFRLD